MRRQNEMDRRELKPNFALSCAIVVAISSILGGRRAAKERDYALEALANRETKMAYQRYVNEDEIPDLIIEQKNGYKRLLIGFRKDNGKLEYKPIEEIEDNNAKTEYRQLEQKLNQ